MERNLALTPATDTWLLLRTAVAAGLHCEAGGDVLVARHAQGDKHVTLRLPLGGKPLPDGGPPTAALSDAEALAWYGRGWDALLREAAVLKDAGAGAGAGPPPEAPPAAAAPKRQRKPESQGLKLLGKRGPEGGALTHAHTA